MCAPASHEAALLEALAILGDLYGSLDDRSPESSEHLNATFDACVRALGDGMSGDFEPLAEATNRVRAIASMFETAGTGWVSERFAA